MQRHKPLWKKIIRCSSHENKEFLIGGEGSDKGLIRWADRAWKALNSSAGLRDSIIVVMGALMGLAAAVSSIVAICADREFGAELFIWTSPAILIYALFLLMNLDYVRDENGVIRDSFGTSNILTSARIISVAPMLVSLFYGYLLAGLIIYCLAAMTDVADGIIARRFSQTTLMGVILDPVGDILSTEAVCIFLWVQGSVPLWLLILLSGRYFEFFAGLLFLRWVDKEPELKATKAGKIVGVIQFSGFALLLLDELLAELRLGYHIKISVLALLGISFAAVIISQTSIGIRAIKTQRIDKENIGG